MFYALQKYTKNATFNSEFGFLRVFEKWIYIYWLQ